MVLRPTLQFGQELGVSRCVIIFCICQSYIQLAIDLTPLSLLSHFIVAVSNSSGMKSMLLPVNINMNSGSRRSFYITTNSTTSYVLYGANFTTGSTPSQTVQETGTGTSSSIQNNHIYINMGTANEYPFGKVIAPRYFNGAVTYRKR